MYDRNVCFMRCVVLLCYVIIMLCLLQPYYVMVFVVTLGLLVCHEMSMFYVCHVMFMQACDEYDMLSKVRCMP